MTWHKYLHTTSIYTMMINIHIFKKEIKLSCVKKGAAIITSTTNEALDHKMKGKRNM